jgi:hypothetical protein
MASSPLEAKTVPPARYTAHLNARGEGKATEFDIREKLVRSWQRKTMKRPTNVSCASRDDPSRMRYNQGLQSCPEQGFEA